MLKKKVLKISSLCAAILLPVMGFSSHAYAAAEGKITFRADNWAPYNAKPGTDSPGLMIEVAQYAFGKENVDYQTMPWKKAIVDTRNGDFDAIVGAAQSDAPDFLLSLPLGKSKNCFVTKKTNTWEFKDNGSIKNKRFGTIASYAYPDFVNAYVNDKENNGNVEISGDGVILQLLKMLSLDRIDVVPEDANVLNYIFENNPELKASTRIAGCAEKDSDVFDVGIAFSKRNQARATANLTKLNAMIKAMINNDQSVLQNKIPSMDTLVKKYKMTKWW